jgi:hypothetical protein
MKQLIVIPRFRFRFRPVNAFDLYLNNSIAL